ncbi:MAG: beta-lactamase family protein [Acidobacteriota bacterium]|nr:beta-lactamase family protein [Acidobacteriota bacterium]
MRNLFLGLLILAGSLVPAHSGGSDLPEPDRVDAYRQRLDEITPRYLETLLVPGVAVALIEDGRVVYTGGYGYADMASKKAVTADTVFNIGSISKTVSTWGVMRLVETGKVDLDVPVERYLTRWKLPPSQFDANGVTVRRLLSHTAGLSLHGYPGFGPNDRLPTIEASLKGAINSNQKVDVRLIMEPGTRWKYSGGGYTILQLLIEELSGQSFNDYMKAQVFRPLGMNSSDFTWPEPIKVRTAIPYDAWLEPTPHVLFTARAAAGLHTTVKDLARFAAAGLKGSRDGNGGGGVLKQSTLDLMFQPAENSPNYGLGYSVNSRNGLVTVGHGGSNRGWQAQMTIAPKTGDGIVLLTNSSSGFGVVNALFCDWVTWKTGQSLGDRCKQSIATVMRAQLKKDRKVAEAIALYRRLKQEEPDHYRFGEGELNMLGYQVMGRDDVDGAIEIFKLNVEVFPEAYNPWDSLAEGYMMRGDDALAVKHYRKSLELNPDNRNAVEMIKKIEAKKK